MSVTHNICPYSFIQSSQVPVKYTVYCCPSNWISRIQTVSWSILVDQISGDRSTAIKGILVFYIQLSNMSYFAYACKTKGKNGISRLISELLHTLDSSLRDRLFVLQNEVF